MVLVWERDDPAVRGERRETKGSGWSGRDWQFMAQVNTGVWELDNYDELTFNTTTYDYDALDHLTQVTDVAGNVTTMHYDGLERKDWMDDPDMGEWHYGYDLAGNLTSQIDARGCVISFDYDELNRLTEKRYSGTCSGATVNYFYDEAGHGYSEGRRTRMTDGSGWTAWFYDARGRVTKEIKTIGSQSFTTEYTYDAMDRPVTMKYPDGEVVTHAYNDGGALESLSGYDPYVTGLDYNPLGQITTLSLGNGLARGVTHRG
jgi:YD repeat-containing protein